MGQKVNPLIFRIGLKNKFWDSQHVAKNSEESAHYLFQDLEIRNYIDNLFKAHNMMIHNCIVKRSSSKLNFFIDFYTTSKISIKALHFFSSISNFKSRILQAQKYKRQSRIFFFNFLSIKNKLKNGLPDNNHIKKTNAYFSRNTKGYSGFKKKIIKTLLIFSRVFKASLHFNNTQNESISILYKKKNINFKHIIQGLKMYSREKFFNEIVEILILVFSTKNAAKLLTNFIAFQFQTTKRHNTFLTFLKRAVTLLNDIKYFRIHGLKIIISGKFNGAPRSKKRTIQTGKLPLQNFNSKINYHSTHAYTPYGTFGIKVWVCEQ
jgi:ribosomal protein S3